MKTLDEVIKALDICAKEDIHRTCKDCPYPDDTMCINYLQNDALHYLKTFRAERVFLDELHRELVAQNDNKPLTWSELLKMEGKPVWVEYAKTDESFWVLVGFVYDTEEMSVYRRGMDYADYIYRHEYEDGAWQAYRKERK